MENFEHNLDRSIEEMWPQAIEYLRAKRGEYYSEQIQEVLIGKAWDNRFINYNPDNYTFPEWIKYVSIMYIPKSVVMQCRVAKTMREVNKILSPYI